jgi:hypothetical protein
MFFADNLKGVWLIGLQLEMLLENGVFPHLIMLEIGFLVLTGHFCSYEINSHYF